MGSEAEERPAVSVVMPLHGDGEFLQLALDSVRSQSGASTEIICIDDGLTESAKAVIAGCSAGQRKIRLVRNEGRGIVAALNTGLCAARGEFIARMDADDVCLPDRFAVQLAYLRSHPDVVAVATQAILIDANGKQLRRLRTPVGCDRVYASLDVSCALIHPTVMMRKAAARRVGGYRIGFDGAEDHELWLRLRRISKLDNLPEPLLLYRAHAAQMSVRKQWRQARLAALAIVGDRLLKAAGGDLLGEITLGRGWRAAIQSAGPAVVDEVRSLTAFALAGNGGTLRQSGARYLRGACGRFSGCDTPYLRDRLALACVRHQIALLRTGRRLDALAAAARDFCRWRGRLFGAYVRQASILWGFR